jgi:tetratricopeptide (TPR) repeat protein
MPASLEEHLFAPGPKRVLSLDGGGVRGIVSIAFLRDIEKVLKERSGRADFRLCDYFDLVGGTSVGSLLATLIALGYPVSEIEKMFREWAPEIFRRPWMGIPILRPLHSSDGLEKRVREVLKDCTLESQELKTGLAIITKRVDTGSPWVLTNNPRGKYWNDPDDRSYVGNKHYQVSELVIASAAAPAFFAPKEMRILSGELASTLPKEARGKQEMGLFVDGAVSPFNDPSLQLLMLAGLKGHGFNWKLGRNYLHMVSVGAGSYRMPLVPGFFERFPLIFAGNALKGLIADAQNLSLTLMQWCSAPNRPWEINGEIGTMEGELLSSSEEDGEPRPLLSYVRYNVSLEEKWLRKNIGRTLAAKELTKLQTLDQPEMINELHDIGALAAAKQVGEEDFPACFAPSSTVSSLMSIDPSHSTNALDPNFAAACNNRGRSCEQKGEVERAIADYTKAIAIDPNYATAYYNRGTAYARKGEVDRAIADYNKAIAIDPNDATSYYNRGHSYEKKGEFDRAIADYDKAIATDRNFAEAYYNRGTACARKGEVDRAIADYNKAIAIDPNDATSYYNRALAYYHKGEFDRTIADFRKVLEIDPSDQNAKEGLKRLGVTP